MRTIAQVQEDRMLDLKAAIKQAGEAGDLNYMEILGAKLMRLEQRNATSLGDLANMLQG